jgi:isocitrate lyase
MKQQFIADLERRWATSSRWAGIARPYTAEDVWRLKGSLDIAYTLAEVGAARLWRLLHD